MQISLQIGLHQSRSPYCHLPKYTQKLGQAQLKQRFKLYVEKIVAKFDQEVNLIQYQLEPEIAQAQK